MALSNTDIDLMYEEVLARHATTAEQQAFAALSLTQTKAAIEADVATLPEATALADPLIRLYQGAFGRLPDTIDPNGNYDTGAQSGYWVNMNALRSGVTLVGMAEAFVVSSEFHTLYGTTSVTSALITAYYQHILGRDPSSAEVAAWQATGLDAAHILVGFTQSAEFIARSQTSVDAFKIALADGQHPAGPLPPPPPQLTLTSDHDIGGVNEGQTVTFTLQSTSSADFGKTFSYNISGVSAADIVGGQLAGTVTLDAQGLAHVALTLVADNLTEGPETLTLAVGALTDSVTVNDTSITPPTQYFTATVGETLTGTNGPDTFVGVVDRTFVNDQTTLSNIVDIANGGAGIDTEKVFVLNNFFGTEITPAANSVEIFQVTDTPGSAFDMRLVPDVLEIDEVNSDNGTVFNNVQSLVDIGLISPDANGVDMTVNVANTVASGNVNVTLVDAGPNGSPVDIRYDHQNGSDVVSGFTFNVTGQNQNVNLFNTTLSKFINVNGSDSTAFLNLDLNDSSNGLGALTSIDASGYAGALTMTNIGFVPGSALQNNLTVMGAQGNNILTIRDANNKTVDVTTYGGVDRVEVDNQGTGEVTVKTGDGNGDIARVFSSGVGPSGNVEVDVGNGNGDAVTIVTNNNTVAGNTVTVNMGTGTSDSANITLGNFHTLTATALGDHASIIQGNAASNAAQTATADGGDATVILTGGANSNLTIEATGTGGAFSAVNGPFTAGFNPMGISYNQFLGIGGAGPGSTIKITSGGGADYVVSQLVDPTDSVTISTGAGDDKVLMFDFGGLALHAGVSLDGGAGTDILDISSAMAHGGPNGATIAGFEVLEIYDSLNSDVVVSDFGVGINHVILDQGTSGGGAVLEGILNGFTLDMFGTGTNLALDVTGASVHTNDVVNIDLHHANNGANQNFGNIDAENVETLHITSDGLGTGIDTLAITNLGPQHTTVLNLDGNHELDLTSFGIGNFLTQINASSMTGGLHYNGMAFSGQNVVAHLGSGADVVAFGNGNNQVDAGGGNDSITVGSGSNAVTGGAGVDTINFAGHGVLTDTIIYNAIGDSAFANITNTADTTHVDQINGFAAGTDKIDISAFANTSFTFAGNVGSALLASADIAGDAAGTTTAVFNTATHTLYIDVNGDHVLDAAHDVQIHLVGVGGLTAANFIV